MGADSALTLAAGVCNRQAHGTAHACAAQPAIAIRIFGQILLMIAFRIIKVARGQNFGGDVSKPGLRQRPLKGAFAFLGLGLLIA